MALALCVAAVVTGVALFLLGVWIDPARRLHRLNKEP